MKVGVEQLLRQRYSEPEWFSATEVTLGRRRADFVAANLWQSRGRLVIAIEIKRSRSDWLRELNDPAKQDRIFAQCDQLYLAVSEASIVQPGELPANWGLLVQCGSRLVQRVKPKHIDGKPTRELWTRLLQREIEGRDKVRSKIRDEVRAELKDKIQSNEVLQLKRQLDLALSEGERRDEVIKSLSAQADTVDAIEKMQPWQRKRFLDAAQWVMDNNWWRRGDTVADAACQLQRLAESVRDGCEQLKAILESEEAEERIAG